MSRRDLPLLSSPSLKNDALFLAGAAAALPWVHAYEQQGFEVVYGPACRVEQEVDVAACEADRVPLSKRRGGGGVVLLADGMVVVAAVAQRGGRPIERLHATVQQALLDVLNPHVQGRLAAADKGDLAADGRKVLGSSLYLSRGPQLFFYQASLLVSCDVALFDRYLKRPLREPAYRKGRGHAEFCTSLARAGSALSCREVADLLSGELPGALKRRLAG